MISRTIIVIISIIFSMSIKAQHINKNTETKIDSILKLMTLEEKVGQLNQFSSLEIITGPIDNSNSREDYFKRGLVGSLLNVTGVDEVRKIQKYAVEQTRLGIPVLFAFDVIHGYRTIFPIPLAESCSWDLDAMENSARIAAIEATAAGLNWTFAPMVDISRDPRWGRVMEGAGEDPFYASLVAKSRVKGFQGNNLSDNNTLVACAKHFAAYGAIEGGREYNTVDVSKRILHEIHLKPFKAAKEAGVATFMSSFNELDGLPAATNKYLLQETLRDNWNFEGFVVSDWGTFGETVIHGTAHNINDAAIQAINSGSDMDMESMVYLRELAKAVKDKKVDESTIDLSVRRILRIKFAAGLFDDPYKYLDKEREEKLIFSPKHLEASRDMARKSIVLLKNSTNILPLDKKVNKIAVIGFLADSKKDMNGFWSAKGRDNEPTTLLEGIKDAVFKNTEVLYSKAGNINKSTNKEIEDAVKTAKQSDVVVVAVGETKDMSGEGASRAYLNLPGNQLDLLKELKKTGKPIVVVLMNGRPLVIPEIDNTFETIVETWWLGTKAGNAISDVLFGDYNPSGKLTMSFPYAVGQIPVYYNHKNTGRPENSTRFSSKYIDIPNEPLYPFGYGLSYTKFNYSEINLSSNTLKLGNSITAKVTITNTGDFDGEEVVQLYIRDIVASVTRPVKELKGFEKIFLRKGESKEIEFTINSDMLSFFDVNMLYKAEIGDFKLFIGTNSKEVKETDFSLVN